MTTATQHTEPSTVVVSLCCRWPVETRRGQRCCTLCLEPCGELELPRHEPTGHYTDGVSAMELDRDDAHGDREGIADVR